MAWTWSFVIAVISVFTAAVSARDNDLPDGGPPGAQGQVARPRATIQLVPVVEDGSRDKTGTSPRRAKAGGLQVVSKSALTGRVSLGTERGGFEPPVR